MGSQGTVGGSLTSQKRGSATLLREKPVPTDPYSLPQAYQRWDYKDYAYQWTLLTNTQKQVYRSRASRYHITGFSLYMRESLRDLPDLLGRWHLDERAGAVAHDTSKSILNGTIVGATLGIDGPIATAYSFDGINDYISMGVQPILQPTVFTAMAFIRIPALPFPNWGRVFSACRDVGLRGWSIWGLKNFSYIRFGIADLTTTYIRNSPILQIDTIYHIAMSFDGSNIQAYIDGTPLANFPNAVLVYGADPFMIGAGPGPTNSWKDLIDEPKLYNRVLNDAEVLRHSLRRYPA